MDETYQQNQAQSSYPILSRTRGFHMRLEGDKIGANLAQRSAAIGQCGQESTW